MAIVILTTGNLPEGYCWPSNPQQYLNDIVPLILAQIPGSFSSFNFGPNRPAPENQDSPWLRTDNAGIIDGWYTFSGDWVRPYPVPISSPERRLWVDAEAALVTYDGGSSGTVTDRTGPFWQRDRDFDFRVPLGVGVSPAPYLTQVDVNTNGGSEKVVLDASVVPNHKHLMPNYFSPTWFGSGTGGGLFWDDTTGNVPVPGATTDPVRFTQGSEADKSDAIQLYTAFNGDSAGGSPTPLSLMNPYRGVFFIKRTARRLIVAP